MTETYSVIDTHCHPQFPQYDADRDEVIGRAQKRGIGMVCVGTDVATSAQAVALAEHYEGLYASVGLHPNDNLGEVYVATEYEKLVSHPRVVAVGEIGLDYFRTTDDSLKEKQRSRFDSQLGLAERVQKPVIIHCRDAHEDMVSIIHTKEIQGVIHSFNGTIEQATAYLNEGLYIGLNGIMTFSKNYIPLIRFLPASKLLLETDAPYLSPEPHRGKRNEPLYIEAVGNYIAAIRGVAVEELFRETTTNARKLFSL